ncbi:MAG: hypothetical protein AAGA21_13505 [Pseudomonadota bacterium]
MPDSEERVSSLIGDGIFLRFSCSDCVIPGVYYMGSPIHGLRETLSPREVIARYGDLRLSELTSLRCTSCGSDLSFYGILDRESLMSETEFKDYAEDVFTQYLIKFVVLAVSALGLMGLSTVLPKQLALILIPSLLMSATLIVIFLIAFNYWDRFRLTVVLFEQNIRSVTLAFLFACLIVAMLAFAAVRLL